MYELCSKLLIHIPERRHDLFMVNFDQISHIVRGVSIVDFEQVNLGKVMRRSRIHNYVNIPLAPSDLLVLILIGS